MLKITRNVVTRHITEEEFKKMKGADPFKTLRGAAKGVNFLSLFGGSAKVLSSNALELSWTEQQIDDFIEANNCYPELDSVKMFYKTMDPVQQKYVAVATRIRNNFFQAYPGLQERIRREQAYAAKNGFCRTHFGMTRNLIELMLRQEYDDKINSKKIRNLNNISANVRCQNMEACIRGRAMYDIQCWLIRTNRKSWVWNEIHDSMDYYIYKPELKDVLSHIKHVCERKIPELKDNWVPLLIDAEISDLNDSNHPSDCYKHGRPWVDFNTEVEWDDLQYEDPDPFGVELLEDFDLEYFSLRKDYWKKKKKEDPLEAKINEYLSTKYLGFSKPAVRKRVQI